MANIKRRVTGFTLVELMITVAVVAILAAIAIPNYRQHIIRGKRSAAQAVMMDIANREQQFLLANRSYADTTALTASGYALPSEVGASYTLAVDTTNPLDGPPTFVITLTPISSNSQASDGPLGLDEKGTKTPPEKWRR